MTLADAIRVLVIGAGRQFPVLSVAGLRVLFSDDDDAAFRKGLRRLVDVGLLERVARGLYLNLAVPRMGLEGLGVVARHLRPRHLCYLSYESAAFRDTLRRFTPRQLAARTIEDAWRRQRLAETVESLCTATLRALNDL